MKIIKSIIVWPREVYLGWDESAENKSEDTHYSQETAEAVCLKLIRQGLGRDGKYFPVDARVEIDGEVVWSWRKRRSDLELLKEEFNKKLDVMTDKDLIDSFAAMRCTVVVNKNEN